DVLVSWHDAVAWASCSTGVSVNNRSKYLQAVDNARAWSGKVRGAVGKINLAIAYCLKLPPAGQRFKQRKVLSRPLNTVAAARDDEDFGVRGPQVFPGDSG